MRLFELLNEDPVLKHHDVKQTPLSPREKWFRGMPRTELRSQPKTERGTQYLGGGAFAHAVGHDDNPHEVVKLSEPSSPLLVDGYDFFLQAILSNDEMKNNPHFPRILSARQIYDRSNRRQQLIVRMERLYHTTDLSMEEFELLCKRMFRKEHIAKEFARPMADWERNSFWRRLYYAWTEQFLSHTEIESQPYAQLRSSKLKRALDIIEELGQKHFVRLDIHAGNLMIRRTQYGPILVITDPLAGERLPKFDWD